ncbi:uncharacterized protein LOC134455281 [Engraulis encrasicolus]|uniref:uncharacterized protein LOC134455281 n=1 Tax=Engraulis encrasicolus TaxID=184585 RepID=UPI002FD6568E
MSTSFGEWQLDDPTDDPQDDSFKLPSDHNPSSPSDSDSASTSSYGYRSPSIRKTMRETYCDIRHEFDVWHVNKSVKKKLVNAANKKENQDLQTWLKSISNHLYWSCSSSHGDGEECVRRWKSLLHHIVGIHRWEEDGEQHTCHHAPLTDDEQRRKRWMKVDSPAYKSLKSIVLDKNLLRDLKQMALFKHTGPLEVFHSSMLKYTQKRLHFSYDAMLARTQLAVMDHNANIGKEQAKTKEGQPRFACAYSKASRQWTARPVYERGEQPFRKNMMEDTLRMRDESSIEDWPPSSPSQEETSEEHCSCPPA